jgi:hypothetical protein
MGEYCEGLNALNLNHAEENDDLAETNAEENDDGAKTPTEENIDLNKATAEEFNEATKEAAEENNALGQDAAEENTDLNEGPSWGLPPAANPWAASGKSGGPTGTSPAPSPLPSVLNDPISPPWTPSDQAPPLPQSSIWKKEEKIFYSGSYNFLFPITEVSQNGLSHSDFPELPLNAEKFETILSLARSQILRQMDQGSLFSSHDHAEILLEIKAKIRFPETMIELATALPTFHSNWLENDDPDCTPKKIEKNLLSYMSQWPRGVKPRENKSKRCQGYGSETEVPTSRGGTRWVLDFRTLNSVSASQDTHSEKSSSSPAPRSRNESPVPTSWSEDSPPSTSQRTRPWSALERRLLGLEPSRHQGSPAPQCFASESGPPNPSNQGREPPTPLSPTPIPSAVNQFCKKYQQKLQKEKMGISEPYRNKYANMIPPL